jgi:hypothetical protein
LRRNTEESYDLFAKADGMGLTTQSGQLHPECLLLDARLIQRSRQTPKISYEPSLPAARFRPLNRPAAMRRRKEPLLKPIAILWNAILSTLPPASLTKASDHCAEENGIDLLSLTPSLQLRSNQVFGSRGVWPMAGHD